MTPLWGKTEIVASFVASLIPECSRGFGACQAMGVLDRDDKLVAGVVFNNWEPEYGVIEISGATVNRRWLTRAIVREIFSYPFDTLDCQMIVTRVHPKSHLRRIWATVGGVEHMIPRLRGRDTPECLITVTEEAWRGCKFAGGQNGSQNS